MTTITPVASQHDLAALNPSETANPERRSPAIPNTTDSSILSLGGQEEDLNTSLAREMQPLMNYSAAENEEEALEALNQMGDNEISQIGDAVQQSQGFSSQEQVAHFIRSQPQSPVIVETVEEIIRERMTPSPNAAQSAPAPQLFSRLASAVATAFASLSRWIQSLFCCCFSKKQQAHSEPAVTSLSARDVLSLFAGGGDVQNLAEGTFAVFREQHLELYNRLIQEVRNRLPEDAEDVDQVLQTILANPSDNRLVEAARALLASQQPSDIATEATTV
jgi:uncharacterized protein (DUF2267 family)